MWHKRNLTNSIQILGRVYAIQPKSNSVLGYRYEQKCFIFHTPLEWKPDRGLDHAVEKEKNLKPLFALKEMVKKEPGASLPVHYVSKKNKELGIATGVRRVIRNYPSIFEQYVNEKDKLTWFRLTKEALYLDEEEARIHQEQEADAAMRLCKFLMMTREKRIHLRLIDQLKWDMGLPNDYVERLVPSYPDYFSVIDMPDKMPGLDLVCWNDELAVSELQRRAECNGGYQKGMPLAFPMVYSKRYDVKQEYLKWADGWQKLPYISPYEDTSHLDPCSDLLEKRVVGVLHEVLSLMIEKRAVKRYLVELKEYLGLPERFQKCFERHPGIFYLCSKNGSVTVMLREAYKRDELVEAHPLVRFRGKFVHVMKKGAKDRKKGDDKKGHSHQIESVVGESHHAMQKSDADHEVSMEESSDDSTDDEEEFSDEEEDDENTITDESSEDDEEEATSEKNITTYKKQGDSFHSSGRETAPVKVSERGGSRLKLSDRQRNSSRTSRWMDNNRQTSGRQGRKDTSGREAGKIQASRKWDNESKRYGHPSRSEAYERPGNKFTRFKTQDSKPKSRSETYERPGNKFPRFKTQDSKPKSRSETYERPGNTFTRFKTEDSKSKSRSETYERPGNTFSRFKSEDSKSKSRSETYERPGNKFTRFKSQDSKSKKTGKQESNSEASQRRQTKISRKDSSSTRITKFI